MGPVSVIIPTCNGEKTLSHLLEGLFAQTVKPTEVIVVDSASEDRTRRILEDFGIKPLIIKREDFNHGTTRNMAAKIAKGEILVFMTQDAIPADSLMLEELIEPLKKTEVAASFGRHIPHKDASMVEKFAREFNYPDRAIVKGKEDISRFGIKTFFFSNVCSAIKKPVFIEVGMFPETLMNEDMLIASKIIIKGYRIAYQPSARVYHSHDYGLIQQFRRYFDIGLTLSQSSLLEGVKPSREGVRYLKEGIKYFIRQGKISAVISLMSDGFFRHAGYSVGKRYRMIPGSLFKYFSMHSDAFNRKVH